VHPDCHDDWKLSAVSVSRMAAPLTASKVSYFSSTFLLCCRGTHDAAARSKARSRSSSPPADAGCHDEGRPKRKKKVWVIRLCACMVYTDTMVNVNDTYHISI
jgi:hypothetical protein